MKQTSAARLHRRQILRMGAAAGSALVAPNVVRAAVLGREGEVAPSERITLGFIGIGIMGQGHLRVFLGYPDVRVLGVCDVDTWRRENAKKNVETTYADAQASGEYAGCGAYRDFRELLARDDIDAVVVVTGDRWHVPVGVRAAKAGKDIYCEKPMSLTIREATTMRDVAWSHGTVFQTGLQQRSTPVFHTASKIVRSGRLGKISHVYVCFPGTSSDVDLPAEPTPEGLDWDMWLGPAPERPYNHRFHPYGRPPHVVPWHFCRDFGGGNLTSNAVHAFDSVQWALGTDNTGPVKIIPPETGKVPSLTYEYASGIRLQVDWKLDPQKHHVPKGWDPNTRIQHFGALFVGANGWLHVGRQGYIRAYPQEILADLGDLAARPIPNHHRNWLDCIRSRERTACDAAVGCRSTTVSHLGCIAHWTGRALEWDPKKERFVGDEEADRMRSRDKREPWTI